MKNATKPEQHHDPLAFTLGDRLAKAMKVADVTRGDLAEYLGVSPTTIGNYTGDRTPVKKQTLRLWALRTGVPLEWIETGIINGGAETQTEADAHPHLNASPQTLGGRNTEEEEENTQITNR